MAWQGEVVDKQKHPRGDAIVIVVAYSDDSVPMEKIVRTFEFPVGTTKKQVLDKVKEVGAEVRAQYQLLELVDKGQTVAI